MPQLDWQAELESMTRVQKLVHLAARLDMQDVDALYKLNLQQKKAAYESSLNDLAKGVGCSKRAVTSGDTLKLLSTQASEEADSIVNTYNYHLAKEIQNIAGAATKANRHVYASRLRAWHDEYMKWKSAQIALHNDMEWKAYAQSQFMQLNDVQGYAELVPKTSAVCDICKEWVGIGRVKIEKAKAAMETWPPHLNCIHSWKVTLGKVANCDELWLGIEPGSKEIEEAEVNDAL